MNTRASEGRTALAITVLLIATLTVPLGLWGSTSRAQQQGQPSPSGTGPAIQLLNPSDYSTFTYTNQNTVAGPQMSDKDTSDADNASEYHFTAVITNPPAQPYVEFWMIQGSTEFNLGCAGTSFQGGSCAGTFGPNGAVGLLRDIPDEFTDADSEATSGTPGRAMVRAILFANNGQNEVARDNQDVVVNQADRGGSVGDPRGDADPDKAAETVEIVYPTHGGSFGLFRRTSAGAVGVIDVEWSDGTDAVEAYYTVSPTDVDPTWKSCSEEESTADPTTARSAQDGVRCTLVDDDLPENVTGVAVVARDEETRGSGIPDTPEDNSGDAHRVVGYSQIPALVTVTGQTLPATRVNDCSDLLIAQVRDQSQQARPIAGVDVDVHAQGPTDNLAFNTHGAEQNQFNQNNPDRSQAPENHPTETGRQCSNDNRSGNQGVHAVGGGDDRKHIESTDDSDDDGQFTFRLWSDAEGGTRVTAWADTTDDDRFCPNEEAGDAVVTWGSAANDPAPPADGPEPQPCPNPSPSGSASSTSPSSGTSASTSPSVTASTSPSTSASASASASTSPSTSPTSTQSATQTATATQTVTQTATTTTGTGTGPGGTDIPTQSATSVSLETSKGRKDFGRSFTLTGAVTSENSACTTSVPVEILRDVVGGSDEFETVERTQTEQDGAFAATFEADVSATYIAQVAETATCDDATSEAVPVLVRVKVVLKLSRSKIRKGQRVRLSIRTAPCPTTARDKVLLFRAIEGKYGKTGKKRTDDECRATLFRRPRKHAVFQARWPKQMPEYLSGKTRPKAVRVR